MARSGCIFGATGTFKTTAIAHLARYVAETTGKATLLLSADGGGWSPCEEEVLAGMISPYRCDPNTVPLPIVRKISQGYWPVNPEEPDVSRLNFRQIDWRKYGAIAVEGITSIGSMLMRHCADKNLRTGEEGTSKFTMPILVNDEVIQETFTQNSRGHFGFVQNQLYSMVTNFGSLPVSYVLYTAHEKKYAEDGELQCGISAPGKAITPLIPTWVGDCIHAQDFRVTQKERVPDPTKPGETMEVETVGVTCRYYFTKHVDPATGAIFEAKPRVTHSKASELRKVFPGGFFVPTEHHGFDLYLAAVDKLAQDAAQSDSLKDWRKRADEKLGRGVKAQVAAAPIEIQRPLTPAQIMAHDGKLPSSK